jgi:ABC-2 type transport system permease protein
MWFSSIYLKSLRDARVAILGWGIGMGLLLMAVLAAYPSLVTTPAAKASMVTLAGSFAWLAAPVRVDTAGGFVTFKYGVTILLMTVWPMLAGARMFRREEERGSMDALLSLPRTRVRVAVEKVAAMWTALLGMGLLITVLAFAGGLSAKGDISLGQAALFALDIVLVCFLIGGIAMLISQFTQDSGTAAGWTAGLLLIFVVVDMVHRVVPNTDWVSRLSPIYYYNVNKPLVPGQATDVGALLLLLGLSVVLSGAAIWLFARRDVGGQVKAPAFLHLPERAASTARTNSWVAWSLRSIYTRSLGMLTWPTFWWTLAIAGFGGWMVVIVVQTESSLRSLFNSSPAMRAVIEAGGGSATSGSAILSALFLFLPVMLMAFAVTQANRWGADEEDGRLELVLSTPQPRLTVLLGRFAALGTATVVIAVLTLVVTAGVAAAEGLTLDEGNLAAATLSMVPLGLLVAALGYLFSGWLSAAVDTGLLSFLLVIWFFIQYVGPDLHLPESTRRLSAFYYYGTPLLNGLPVASTAFLVVLGALALALASVRFVRKDILN